MKIIILDRHPGEAIILPPSVELGADSALSLPRRPLFLPDDMCATWSARLYLAARVGRLGKSIKARFAERYIDGIGLALRLIPEETTRSLDERCAHRGLTLLFDGAIATGEWLDPATIAADDRLLIEAQGMDPVQLKPDEPGFADALEAVSLHATMKTGDIILPCHFPIRGTIHPGDTFTATINGHPCLNVRIK